MFVIEEYFPNLIHLLDDYESNKKDSGSANKNISSHQNSNEKRAKPYDGPNKGPPFQNNQQNLINQGQGQFPNMMQNPGQMQFVPGQIPGQFGPGQMPGQFGQGPTNNFIIQQGQPGQQFHGSNMGYQGQHKRGSMNPGYQGNNSRYQGRDNYRNNNNYHRNQRGGGYMGNQNNNQGYNKGRHGGFRGNQDFDEMGIDQQQSIPGQGSVNNFQPMFMGMPQGIVGQDSGQGPIFQDASEIQPVQGMVGGMAPGFPMGFQAGPPGQGMIGGMGPGMQPNHQFGFMGQQNSVNPTGNTGVPGFLGNLGGIAQGQVISPSKTNLDNSMISGNIGMPD